MNEKELKDETNIFFNREILERSETYFNNGTTSYNQVNKMKKLKEVGQIPFNTRDYRADEELSKYPNPFFRRYDFDILINNKNNIPSINRGEYQAFLNKLRNRRGDVYKFKDIDDLINVSGVVHQVGAPNEKILVLPPNGFPTSNLYK
jgi:hypothetical protein